MIVDQWSVEIQPQDQTSGWEARAKAVDAELEISSAKGPSGIKGFVIKREGAVISFMQRIDRPSSLILSRPSVDQARIFQALLASGVIRPADASGALSMAAA